MAAPRRLPPRAAVRLQPGTGERLCRASGTALEVDTKTAGRRLYPFDLVFEGHGQAAVYKELVPMLLTEALGHGRSGALLVCGPPKGGKSHTLLGYGADPGLIPLTALDVFRAKGRLQVWISYFEVKGGLFLDRLAPLSEDDRLEAERLRPSDF